MKTSSIKVRTLTTIRIEAAPPDYNNSLAPRGITLGQLRDVINSDLREYSDDTYVNSVETQSMLGGTDRMYAAKIILEERDES